MGKEAAARTCLIAPLANHARSSSETRKRLTFILRLDNFNFCLCSYVFFGINYQPAFYKTLLNLFVVNLVGESRVNKIPHHFALIKIVRKTEFDVTYFVKAFKMFRVEFDV